MFDLAYLSGFHLLRLAVALAKAGFVLLKTYGSAINSQTRDWANLGISVKEPERAPRVLGYWYYTILDKLSLTTSDVV